MRTIHIRHIGPIQDSGLLHLAPVTFFCGKQGSGKSTITKLISTCLWLEKALVKGDLTIKYVTSYNRFRKELCGYHLLTDFFRENSYLKFESDYFVFKYEDGRFSVVEKDKEHFKIPKVMYVPAERNFMVSIEHAEKIRKLPAALQTLQEEYIRALNAIKSSKSLYVGQVAVQYDKLNKITWLIGEGFKIKANQAASGFQSIAPMVLVSDYLADLVENDDSEPMSVEERNSLRREIEKIQRNKKFTDEMKGLLIESLNSKLKLDCFWNIVEEPEQNLYPRSQREILNVLLKNFNRTIGNGLIITTHSPYILNYLSLCIKAESVAVKSPLLMEAVSRIVPTDSQVNAENVKVFEIQPDGTVSELEKYEGMPSDDNFLNMALAETNDLFNQLLDIEHGEN